MKFRIASLVVLMQLSACSPAPQQSTPEREVREPEAATGFADNEAVETEKFMVTAANPHAVEAGYRVLKQGGSAVDAAIAVQAMLGLVEPQSSGIGGGAFILYWDNNEHKLYTIDAREKAPKAATPALFLDENGVAPKWIEAVVGGRSVGVPGVLRGLELAHNKWGKMPWEPLFKDAIALANKGFEVSPRLSKLVSMVMNPGLPKMPVASAYFYPDGEPLQAGDILVNKPYARSLTMIAEQGADAFYTGPLAKQIADAVQNSPIHPGLLSVEDLANYHAKLREPVCGEYRQYTVCGMGPPSSGGITTLQTLGILENFAVPDMPVNGEQFAHVFTQASRLAFADRNQWIADTDFVDVPIDKMLNKDYLAQRATLIGEKDMGKAQPGEWLEPEKAQDVAYELPNTSHITIVDAEGNVLSMTTSIEMGFGSTVMTGGFLLNNQLTDFSLNPKIDGHWIANRVESEKRPRSSMSPTIILNKDGSKVLHALGSPGGSRIINYVTQTAIGLMDWKLNMQQAIDLGHITNRNDYTALEQGTDVAKLAEKLKARGHDVKVMDLNSGLHGISLLSNGKLQGGADPRREGIVMGE
ncbi:gamma-glutamyltransferase [Idiomarina tyrosinivorans]|uniref:Glutathione hydrolase proenzyme n=1 Tax=Idiomarina tyrosinivorans TaxID=1445662 RepID=A0A432ZTH6_9GAMM|nr:gamma-glutamyltransferase [Idiomarina tyrosinivorans]RUO81199.1 gamma-glutamyltransferase [Idiomarina tyrosinivorans]